MTMIRLNQKVLKVTDEELQLIRTALCDKALKTLGLHMEVQKECQAKGLKDDDWYLVQHDKIRSLIAKIDII